MKEKKFILVASIFFTILAVVHLLRMVYGWQVAIASQEIPLWVSGIGIVITGIFALVGFSLVKK